MQICREANQLLHFPNLATARNNYRHTSNTFFALVRYFLWHAYYKKIFTAGLLSISIAISRASEIHETMYPSRSTVLLKISKQALRMKCVSAAPCNSMQECRQGSEDRGVGACCGEV